MTEPLMCRVATVRDRLVTTSKAALKTLAFRWFMTGFSLSGHGFNGETLPTTHEGLRSLLRAEFHRRWSEDHG